MSRSLYGHMDRRIPEKAVPNTAVHDEYEKLYNKCSPAVMPKNRPVLETQANQAAFRSLSEEDRARIEVMRIQLKERCGVNFGEAAANQILARIGVLLLVRERKMKSL